MDLFEFKIMSKEVQERKEGLLESTTILDQLKRVSSIGLVKNRPRNKVSGGSR